MVPPSQGILVAAAPALTVHLMSLSRVIPEPSLGRGCWSCAKDGFTPQLTTPEMDPKHPQHQNLPCFIFFSSQLIPLFSSAVQSRAELTWKQIITLKKLSTRNNSTHS